MADLLKNEQLARDFVIAALHNPHFIGAKMDVGAFSDTVVNLYKDIYAKLEADKPKPEQIKLRSYR